MHFERLEAMVDSAARKLPNPHEPNWKPLEALIGPALFGQFMFMGTVENGNIVLYKHGMTRRYLNVGVDLRTFQFVCSSSPSDNGFYKPIPLATALGHVFADCEQLGGKPNVAYDDTFKDNRNEALAKAGYKVISAKPGKGVE